MTVESGIRYSALRAPLAALPAALLAVPALAWAAPPGSLDDVFVVLCDARAWLGGALEAGAEGLSRPTTEGSTSPLDVGVKALILALWPDADPLRASGWVELALLIAIAWLTSWSLWLVGSTEGQALIPVAGGSLVAVGVILAPGLAESAAFRLEGPLFALAWVGACAAAAKGRGRSTLLWALALGLTRPEGLFVAPLLGWIAGGTDRRASVRLALLGLGMVAAVTAARFAVFGEIVPNTYFAKASDSRWQEILDGAEYLGQAALSWAGIATVLLAIGVGLASTRVAAAAAAPARRLLVLAAAYAGIVILSGGDGYLGARLAMPVGLAVWLAAGALWASAPVITRRLVVLAVALQLIGALPRPWPGAGPAFETVGAAVRVGPTGLEAFDGDARVFAACVDALGVEVFAHRHVQRYRWFEPTAAVLDLTGLTDAEVARRPAAGQVRFGRDALDLALARGVGAIHLDPMRARPSNLAAAETVRALSDPDVAALYSGPPYVDLELARRMAEHYRPASFPLPEAGGYFNLFVRADLAARFRAAGFTVGDR